MNKDLPDNSPYAPFRAALLALGISVAMLALEGCVLQPAYSPPVVAGPSVWSVPLEPTAHE